MILYYTADFTDAGRIKQRILCCRKFIIIFGSRGPVLLSVYVQGMAEILHPFLTKPRQILLGNIVLYFFEKECFRSSFTLTIRHFETGLLKKSGKIR